MNELLKLFVIVSTFAFNASCMNTSISGLATPPAPRNVEFGECFVVVKISSIILHELYDYHHICPGKLSPHRLPRPDLHEKNWYFVGKLRDSAIPSDDLPRFDYQIVEQSMILFTFLKEAMVKFMVKRSTIEYEVTFQSLEHSQAFYAMVYENVDLIPAGVPNKICLIHEITTQEMRRMGYVVKVLQSRLSNLPYIIFENERGKPILIFAEDDASMVGTQDDKPQLLLRIHAVHYILTFSSCAQAEEFGNDLPYGYLSPLDMDSVDADIRARFYGNNIKIDIVQELA